MSKEEELIQIVDNQDLNLLKKFINENKDFNFDFTTKKGQNLLHYVSKKVSSNTLSIIQILIEKGVDPQAVDEKFMSALDIAKESNNIPAMTIMKHYVSKKSKEDQTNF